MKNQKQKNKDQQNAHNHPTIFSVSIFQSAEQFIAVYLALQSQNDQLKINAGKYLQNLLQRTKSPPIALTYTKEFTLLKSESQIQLTIIRFISQLSDLSAGKSMQSSLSFIIENSSFLTELRHNLTHRVMVKGLVIERGKQMILSELKQKYWKVMFQKVWNTYFIDREKVYSIFRNIVSFNDDINNQQQQDQGLIENLIQKSNLYNQYLGELQNQKMKKLSFDYLFNHCPSNYEFKSLLRGYIVKKVLPELKQKVLSENNDSQIDSFEIKNINKEIVNGYFSLLNLAESSHFNIRAVIIFSTLLELLLSLHKYEQASSASTTREILTQITIVLINQLQQVNKNTKNQNTNKSLNPTQLLCSPVIIKKFRQVYLLKYISEYKNLIDSLPEEILSEIKKYWQQKQIQMDKKLILDF